MFPVRALTLTYIGEWGGTRTESIGPISWTISLRRSTNTVVCSSPRFFPFRRLVLVRFQRKVLLQLDATALNQSGGKLTTLEKQEIALALGLGHAATTGIIFFLSLLHLSIGEATFMSPGCQALDFFQGSALQTLGMTLLHTYSMPIFSDALDRTFNAPVNRGGSTSATVAATCPGHYENTHYSPPRYHFSSLVRRRLGEGKYRAQAASVPLLHLVMGLTTTASVWGDDNCVKTFIVVPIVGVAVAAWGLRVIWGNVAMRPTP